MNFFEQELRRFTGKTTAFKSCKALCAGRACFIPLSGSRRARRTFPHGFTLWDSTLLHSEAAQKSICHDRCEAVFHALCECAGIPQEVLIQAARIEDRYYERGGTRCLDPERLIRSLL